MLKIKIKVFYLFLSTINRVSSFMASCALTTAAHNPTTTRARHKASGNMVNAIITSSGTRTIIPENKSLGLRNRWGSDKGKSSNEVSDLEKHYLTRNVKKNLGDFYMLLYILEIGCFFPFSTCINSDIAYHMLYMLWSIIKLYWKSFSWTHFSEYYLVPVYFCCVVHSDAHST